MTRQFTWNDATFTIADPTVETAMNVEYVLGVLRGDARISARLFNHYLQYANFLAMSSVEGDPGFSFPSLDADEADLRAGFEAYKLLPSAFRSQWNNASTLPVEKKASLSDAPLPPTSTPISNATPEPNLA